MTLKYIIIDDEPLAREGVKIQADKIPNLICEGSFSSPMEANDVLLNQEIDLMFLDIEMPGLNGLEFLKTFKFETLVILTTAYPQYALEAFELDVIDYVMKPIRFERFVKAINKVKDFRLLKTNESNEVDFNDDYIYIKSERKYVKLYLKDIRFIKGLKDYVIIHTDHEKFMTAMNVKTVHSKLNKGIFARVSKSYIINVNHITSIENDMIWIGNEDIPLGNTYKSNFIEKHIKDKLIERN